MIASWPESNPASTLEPGERFTLAGVYKPRRDWLSRLLAFFGLVRYSAELQVFRVVGKYSATLAPGCVRPFTEYEVEGS